MDHKQNKLENPVRLKELDPLNTLTIIGLDKSHVLADIGAGSGIFAIPAAKVYSKVYALEVSDDMLAIIGDKAKANKLENIELVKVNDNRFDISDGCVDLALMVTVLHEISERSRFICEVKRILKEHGKLAVIEFFKEQTPMGPPIDHRISKEEVKGELALWGFSMRQDFDLGPNFYCLVFEANGNF